MSRYKIPVNTCRCLFLAGADHRRPRVDDKLVDAIGRTPTFDDIMVLRYRDVRLDGSVQGGSSVMQLKKNLPLSIDWLFGR